MDARADSSYTGVKINGGPVSDAPKKKSLCMICGKPSPKTICVACAGIVQGEALHHKKKDEKKK